MKKKTIVFILLMLSVSLMSGRTAFAGNTGNNGFESEIGGTNFGNWNETQGVTRIASGTLGGFSASPEGGFYLRVPAGTFTFQISDAVKEGDFVTFTALAESSIAPANGGRMKIEFKKLFEDGTDELISSVESVRINTGNAPAGGGFTRFTVSGVAPKGTRRVIFVLDGNGAGNTLFDSANGLITPVGLAVSLNKTRVKPGEVVVLTTQFQNNSEDSFANSRLEIDVPAGLNVLPDVLNQNASANPIRIPLGTLAGNQVITNNTQLFVTAGAEVGKQYEIKVSVTNGSALSEVRYVRLMVKADPVFDEGTIIGKVFDDKNKNGTQDEGEDGIPWVRLMTEEGIVVITDQYGRYNIPGVKEGRHVVKIDGHTLPEGSEFITEESYLVKTTPGILNKANFAVALPPSKIAERFRGDLTVNITQGLDTSRPRLDVRMEPEVLRVGLGVLEKEPVFKFENNYSNFIRRWYLEVRDELGREVWTGFGVSEPPAEVLWSGQTESGLMIRPGTYSYQFKVEDDAGRQDWSPLHFFRVISKKSPEYLNNAVVELPTVGDFNLFKEGKQSIPLIAKPTLRIQGKTKPDYKIEVNGVEVPVDTRSGIFQTEAYVSPGKKEVLVTATSPQGEVTTFRDTVEVKDSIFFMVGLAEGEVGVNFTDDSNLESAGSDPSLKRDVYTDGRAAYYLMGKLRGKFLIRSHYDSDDKRSAIFTNLDPEDYYPVYGDYSTRNYEARDTQSRFFFIVEMERSFLKWGNFQTEFNDTELATYNRSLSGLKVHYETVTTTPYGDPNRGLDVFWSKSGQRGDHNELAVTGGTLYYLRNRRVVEGSEKIRVEYRDKILNVPIYSYDLQEGVDYDIDYDEGRILLTKPISSKGPTDTLTSVDIEDGSPAFIIADYEFDTSLETFENGNRGIRGYTHMGDHLKVGATYVEEVRDRQRYDMRGVDLEAKVGRNTRVYAEYAETLGGLQTANSVSYNGGLSFLDLTSLRSGNTRLRENAYIIRAESKPTKHLELSGFVQGVQPGFSNDHIRSQEGEKKHGVSIKYKFNDYSYVRYRFDSRQVIGPLLPAEANGIYAAFQNYRAHTAQAVYDDGRWLAETEFQHQTDREIPQVNLSPELLNQVGFNDAISTKLGYHFNDKLLGYVRTQTSLNGKADHQFGFGARYEIVKNIYGYIEQMFGNIGDSTFFGFEKQEQNGGSSYASLKMVDRGIGTKALSTVIGSAFPLSDKSRFFSEREYSIYNGEEGFADGMGVDGKLSSRWDYRVRFERRHLDNATTRILDQQAENSYLRTNTYTTLSGELRFHDDEKLKVRTYWELRRDSDTPKLWQWVTQNLIEYQYTESLQLLTSLKYGGSRFNDPNDIPATFFEFTTGFAYRPIDNDRLNIFGRYTYTRDLANDAQFNTSLFNGTEVDETAHILAIDLAYDLFKSLTLIQKIAYKRGIYAIASLDPATNPNGLAVNQLLWVNRFNYHITRKWDLALEYRALWQTGAADALRHGALVEVDREFYDYVRLGIGYDFTDFNDNLRSSNDYSSHGPFFRMTGKF
ncbi:MAG: hypothetical protein H6757_02375 [Candidatus Omnitrophica bacterium]|nr:hypothetical protein [Candidatus Omnitrophota bacterium]